MKLRFSYWDISKYVKNDEPNHRKIRRAFEMIDKSEQIRNSYGQYLLSSLDSDFLENRFGACDELLKEIEKIEAGKIECFVFDYNGFIHYVNKKSAAFEHAIFGVCPHWPLWSCPLSHYKIAVQTARDFFAMPESLDTELIVELPESDMAQIALFPPKMVEKDDAFDLKHD
jgi:hypothetical protein